MKILLNASVPLRNSILARLGLAMAVIALLSVVSIAISASIADNSLGKANAINLSGSLRMMSFRLLSEAQAEPKHAGLSHSIGEFESRFYSLERFVLSKSADYGEIHPLYQRIAEQWRQLIRPRLLAIQARQEGTALTELAVLVPEFVEQIDRVVFLIEVDLERKIGFLKNVQIFLLVMTVLVCLITLWMAGKWVLRPLHDLLAAANELRQRNFNARVDHTGADELGQLGLAFNTMASKLAEIYAQLEDKVAEKTAELTRSNLSLDLLYRTALRLSASELSLETLRGVLREVESALNLRYGTICLCENGVYPAHKLVPMEATAALQPICQRADCPSCFRAAAAATGLTLVSPSGSLTRFEFIPLSGTDSVKGVMPFAIEPGNAAGLPAWQRQVLETVGRNLSVALAKMKRLEDSHRLAVLEERSAIARELHDSIAQSLSYLRIQVTRLEKSRQSGEDPREVILELKHGVAGAYRELRELISAFRLSIDARGFHAALQETVAEFSRRGAIPIELDNRLATMLFSANEEIHVLRIIREALANIEKHAKANQVRIQALMDEHNRVHVSVEDDGCGIGLRPSPDNHYGLIIMEDRAQNLGGTIRVGPREGGGTVVRLDFQPEKLRASPNPAEEAP